MTLSDRGVANIAQPTTQWQTTLYNNVMHAKPDLRVVLKWMIYRSGSVITDVIRRKARLDFK